MCLQKFSPPIADFLKSATGQFAKLHLCACTNSHPSLQILWNQPLDSLQSYLYMFVEILPTPVCRFLWNLPLDSLLSYLYMLPEIPPQFADFVKSSTGQFAKLPICACTNSPPKFPDFVKSATGQFAKLPTWAYRNPPQFADFGKSATGQFAKLPTCNCRNPPSLQILWNLPLDSLLGYLYVLAENPPIADFVKSATGQFA